ncbi:MAG: hypothetical protein CMB99_16610 [Flavobacteriaceae bacterium]|jgi:DNA primase|nr:hypothetical protein [Flavobacteriaceae bacterium]|tara:strand:+ start:1348 stop:1560 length:213 start_codon:yes stop_codon:yes gene_type:complete
MVYAGTPHAGWVGIYPVGKGRPMREVRGPDGKRVVFVFEHQAQQAALEAFTEFLKHGDSEPEQPDEDSDE